MHPSVTGRTADGRPSVMALFYVILVIVSTLVSGSQAVASRSVEDFSIQQLLTKRFPHRISDDIYLDPCKAGKKIITFYPSFINTPSSLNKKNK